MLQGAGLGEKPPLRRGAGNVVGPTAGLYTFDLVAGEDDRIKPGDTLSSFMSATAADALHVRVVSVGTDEVTVVPLNSVVPTNALTTGVLEQNAEVPETYLHGAIDQIIEHWLWPTVYEVNTDSVTPNLTTGQVEVPATVMKIFQAFQQVAHTVYTIPCSLITNMPDIAGYSTTGKLAMFDVIDGSSVYYSYLSKVTDETENVGLRQLIALGAAALAVGKQAAPAITERSKRDNQGKNQQAVSSVGSTLWRDFLNARAAYGEEASHEVVRWEINRG